MGQRDLNTLRRDAERLELYGQREAILRALEGGQFDVAARLCREAMNDAAYRARYNCAPIGPEGHKRNFEAIRTLRTSIQTARRDG